MYDIDETDEMEGFGEDLVTDFVPFEDFIKIPETEEEALESYLAPAWATHADIRTDEECVWYDNCQY